MLAVFSVEKCLSKSFAHFITGLFVLSLVCVLDIIPHQTHDLRVFSPTPEFAFSLFSLCSVIQLGTLGWTFDRVLFTGFFTEGVQGIGGDIALQGWGDPSYQNRHMRSKGCIEGVDVELCSMRMSRNGGTSLAQSKDLLRRLR